MEIKKKSGHVVLSNLKSEEVFAFLKMQIPAKIVFVNSSGQRFNSEFLLIERTFINGKKIIEVDIDGISDQLTYDKLLSKLSDNMSNTIGLEIMIPLSVFKDKEPLIVLISTIKKDIVSNCIYIDYDEKNNVFEVKNKPFKNGDSDKMFYFEMNDTILGFSEDGPILITDSPNVNSIEDVICN